MKINALASLLDVLGTFYLWINTSEIIIPCSADVIPEQTFEKILSTEELVKHDKISCVADECHIHIFENQGHLDWLVEIPT